MRGNEFLDKMAFVDARFVEEADKKPPVKKQRWTRWCAVAAIFCLAAFGTFSFWNSGMEVQPTPLLEQIIIPELAISGMGYEGLMYHDASEMDNGNPWNENLDITTLPVYRNNAYDASGAGVPKGLDEEEMYSLLDSTVSALGAKTISIEVITNEGCTGEGEEPVITELLATTDIGTIKVYAHGEIVYYLPDDGMVLPDEYRFTVRNTTDSEACETITYLTNLYGELLNVKEPAAVSWGSYNIYGDYNRRYTVYETCGNDVEDILNYNFCSVSFHPVVSNDGNTKLWFIRINNDLSVAEKIDDYPIISVREAKERLLAGNYQTSVPYEMPGEEYIVKVELKYRTGPLEQTLIPYYRFYVLLPEEKRDNELQSYGAYYVPAIADEYIANMPVYDSFFH